MTIRAVYGLPGEGMTYDAIQLQQPTARRELRLLCLLGKSRTGESVYTPVSTLRPVPPYADIQGRWSESPQIS